MQPRGTQMQNNHYLQIKIVNGSTRTFTVQVGQQIATVVLYNSQNLSMVLEHFKTKAHVNQKHEKADGI